MLDVRPVLIVEGDPLIALTLAFAVEDAGGSVIGPAGTTLLALSLLATEPVRAAILDVNLADRDGGAPCSGSHHSKRNGRWSHGIQAAVAVEERRRATLNDAREAPGV